MRFATKSGRWGLMEIDFKFDVIFDVSWKSISNLMSFSISGMKGEIVGEVFHNNSTMLSNDGLAKLTYNES